MHRILITDDLGPAGLALLDQASDVQYAVVKLPSHQKLIELIGECDAIITRSGTPLDAETFDAARKLKIAGRAGVGMDNVDIDAATLRGILVMNTPEANMLAATEMTMALMLASCRRFPWADQSIKRGELNRRAQNCCKNCWRWKMSSRRHTSARTRLKRNARSPCKS